MAPILKETEVPVAGSTASVSSAPHTKPSTEPAARTQPVALEIPVTVNGARTDGSDKRVPFSESTQTVLVLPHGAVVRIATPLASGQLVFLTNEKTKKEVVCQVVKSKSTGSAAAYVELQFTEPSPGFWGLQVPGGANASPAHRPVASVPSVVAKPATLTPTAAAKPPVPAKPVAPVVASMAQTKPVIQAAPPTTVHRTSGLASPDSVPPVSIGHEVSKHFPVVTAPQAAEPVIPAAPVDGKIKSLDAVLPSAPTATAPPPIASHHPAIPVAPVRDYSKEINALFAGPQAPPPPAPAANTAPVPAAPTTDDLKLQAARLQAQLSSMLFTESQTSSKNAATSVESQAGEPTADTVKKVVETTQQDSKVRTSTETKAVVPVRTAETASISLEEEEVKVPSWLAPLSQNSQTVSPELAEAGTESKGQSLSVNSGESFDALATEAPQRSETAVFGGQLLGEATTGTTSSSKGSKKGILIGVVAAALVLLAAGGWYYHQNYSAAAAVSAAHSTNVPEQAAPVRTSAALAPPVESTGGAGEVHSAAVVPPKSNKHPAPAPVATTSPAAPERRSSNAPSRNVEPIETPAKPALGDVHLAAPIVNRSTQAQQAQVGEALPALDAKGVPVGSDPFAVSGRHTPPAAPLPVGGDVKPAQLIKSVPPEYPEMAKAQHVSGKVQIDALVDASGNVASVKVLSGPMLLRKAAVDAVKQWKYSPARLDDQTTSMHLTVTVEFRGQ
jgi:TonB family protein